MKYILALLFLISLNSFATEQIPDKLIFNGEKYSWTGLSPAFMMFRDSGFEAPTEAILSTGLYRKLIMTYTIENDILYLSDVEIRAKSNRVDSFQVNIDKYVTFSKTEIKSVFDYYFPDKKKVPMTNYSRILEIPYGESFFYEINGWSYVGYPNYLIFEIDNGKVNKYVDLTFDELADFKDRQFKEFRKSRNYKQSKKDLKNDLVEYNYFRPRAAKYLMNDYLREIIFELINELK